VPGGRPRDQAEPPGFVLEDLHGPGEDDEEVDVRVPLVEEEVAHRESLADAVGLQPAELLVGQLGGDLGSGRGVDIHRSGTSGRSDVSEDHTR